MVVVGMIALVIVGLAVLSAVAVGVRSIPDINRYLRIRRM
ncbi:DUF6893 family small protein [Nocardia stercoris]